MVYGARPESLDLAPAGVAGLDRKSHLSMTVSVIEPLGHEKDVYLTLPNGQQVVARIEAHIPVTEGMPVHVSIDAARAHVFEPGENGARVTATQPQ